MTKLLPGYRTILSIFMGLMMSLTGVNAATTASSSIVEKQTINVGIYAPFTSKSAYIGRNVLGAMEIARDQLKSTEINYEFYTLDRQADNAHAENTLQKFIDAHHINVLVTEGADSGAMVAPLAKKNKLIHFCLGCDADLGDGTNNFQSKSPNHERGAGLITTMKPKFVDQFHQEYFSHPVTEAGYAYDVFHLLHASATIAMKTDTGFSSQKIASNLLALESGTGLMGAFSLNKNGVSYKKATRTV